MDILNSHAANALVSRNWHYLTGVSNGNQNIQSRSISEPIVAEAALRILFGHYGTLKETANPKFTFEPKPSLFDVLPKVLDDVVTLMKSSVVDKGNAGQIMTQLVFLLAFCSARREQAKTEVGEMRYSKPVTFEAFLNALFIKDVYNDIMEVRQGDAEWEQLCTSTLCFTHFIQLYDYSPTKELLHETCKRTAAIVTQSNERAIDVILILQNGEQLTPVTIGIAGTDSKLRKTVLTVDDEKEWLRKFNASLGKLGVKPPSLGILQQFGSDSFHAEFIQRNRLDLHGLDQNVYRLFEDGSKEDDKARVFELMNEMLTCSNDPLVKEPKTQEHLPVLYKAWAEKYHLLPPPTEETTGVMTSDDDYVASQDNPATIKKRMRQVKQVPDEGQENKKPRTGDPISPRTLRSKLKPGGQ
jgi:hypothetical protein